MLKTMENNRRVIEQDVHGLVYYMNGGLDLNDGWQLTDAERKSMSAIITKHFEAMNPKKTSQL